MIEIGKVKIGELKYTIHLVEKIQIDKRMKINLWDRFNIKIGRKCIMGCIDKKQPNIYLSKESNNKMQTLYPKYLTDYSLN